MAGMTPRHLLSFHVEEHFHAPAFDSPMRRRHWERFESRVERNTEKILVLLAEQNVRATFFVLGWVAERHGGLIRRIAAGGHEIASHGYAHEPVTAQTADQFREDVRKTKRILEDLACEPVLGYRAPANSLTAETNWALPILVEEGYQYDSSLCFLPDRSRPPSGCYRLESSSGPLWEIPINCLGMAGVALPTNGFSIRLISYPLLQKVVRFAGANRKAVVVNLRVWECDPSQPRMKGRVRALFQQYYNLAKLEDRLRMLIQDFQFGPLREALRFAAIHQEPTFEPAQAWQK
jgi:polysaccharide deacetylase family protein (PEP-CTERM system associated)